MEKLSIIQGIGLFKKEFIFSRETKNTRRIYNRSVDLFALFLMLSGLKPPGEEIDIALPGKIEKFLLDNAGIPGINLRMRLSKMKSKLLMI